MPQVLGKDPLTVRGRWIAVAVTTLAMQLSYWPPIAAVAGAGIPDDDAALVAGVALGAVPFVFMLIAFASRHPTAPTAVLRAMGLFAVVGFPLALLNVALGISAGYAAGAVAALRREPDVHPLSARIGATSGAVVAVFLAIGLGGEAGMVLGAIVPFVAPAVADTVLERRAAPPGDRS